MALISLMYMNGVRLLLLFVNLFSKTSFGVTQPVAGRLWRFTESFFRLWGRCARCELVFARGWMSHYGTDWETGIRWLLSSFPEVPIKGVGLAHRIQLETAEAAIFLSMKIIRICIVQLIPGSILRSLAMLETSGGSTIRPSTQYPSTENIPWKRLLNLQYFTSRSIPITFCQLMFEICQKNPRVDPLLKVLLESQVPDEGHCNWLPRGDGTKSGWVIQSSFTYKNVLMPTDSAIYISTDKSRIDHGPLAVCSAICLRLRSGFHWESERALNRNSCGKPRHLVRNNDEHHLCLSLFFINQNIPHVLMMPFFISLLDLDLFTVVGVANLLC